MAVVMTWSWRLSPVPSWLAIARFPDMPGLAYCVSIPEGARRYMMT